MTFAAFEARLKRPSGLLVMTLVATASVGVVRALMYWHGLPGWDDAAHVYKVFLLREGQGVFWDTFWYGGSYGAVTYGFLYYWLAQYVPGPVLVTLASGLLPLFFYLYYRGAWGVDDVWPAWVFIVILCMYQANGQDPFVVALCVSMAGLALLASRRVALGALLVGIGVFANPLGLFVVGVFLLADFVGRPALRRRYLVFAAWLAPFVAVRVAVGVAFSEPVEYVNEFNQVVLFLAFAMAGLALAGLNVVHPRRPFALLFVTYAAVCVVSYLTPASPLGNNVGRFGMVFGASLLLLLRNDRLRRMFGVLPLSLVPIVLFSLLQVSSAYNHYTDHSDLRATEVEYFAPALAAAAGLHDPDYRIHVVALRRHWEALYFPEAGYPITRGWFRQADAIHNSLFYEGYSASEYLAWLHGMGVAYVFLPDQRLDSWSRHERGILIDSGLFEQVERLQGWRVYRVPSPQPLLVALDGGDAHVTKMDHLAVRFAVERPGRFLLKVTHTPYWQLDGGSVRRGADRFTEISVPAAGEYELRFVVTRSVVLDQFGL
jgi:hypothetical protein